MVRETPGSTSGTTKRRRRDTSRKARGGEGAATRRREDGGKARQAHQDGGKPKRAGDGGNSLEVAGVRITSADRVVYPKDGVTKGDIARYWEAVAGAALPLLEGRPLTLVRCPGGLAGDCFYQKHAGEGMPDVVPRIHVPEKDGDAKAEPYTYLDGLPSLIGLVQMGVLEIHVWNARRDRLDRPDTLVMDMDPGPGVAWHDVVRAATALRDLLAELGLRTWPRVTGGKGLHVVAPIDRRSTWDQVGAFARGLAELMASGHPERFVAKASKKLREGRIYVDYLRNGRNATAIGTFSPRARPGALIAFPASWDEVEAGDAPPLCPLSEAMKTDWVGKDPWAGFGDVRQSITKRMLEEVGGGR